MLSKKPIHENQRYPKNTTSRISLVKILFENEGGDYSAEQNIGSLYDSSAGMGGGGGNVSEFYETFVTPFVNLVKAFGYGIEKSIRAGYFFAKKILVNFPRLFNPLTPLIFDDIAAEEKASYIGLDERYSETLKYIKTQLQNNDLKAVAFMMYPSQVLGAKLMQKGPKFAYGAINGLSGGVLERVRDAYNSLPAQQRQQETIRILVQQAREGRMSDSEAYGGGRSYGSRIYEASVRQTKKQLKRSAIPQQPAAQQPAGGQAADKKQQLTDVDFFNLLLKNAPQELNAILSDTEKAIRPKGELAFKNIANKIVQRIEPLKKVINAKNFAEAIQFTDKKIDLDQYKQKAQAEAKKQEGEKINKGIDEEINKLKKEAEKLKDEKKIEEINKKIKQLEDSKESLKKQVVAQVGQQIDAQALNMIKNQARNEIRQLANKLSPIINDPSIPGAYSKIIKTALQSAGV